jgi:hypothetical protein
VCAAPKPTPLAIPTGQMLTAPPFSPIGRPPPTCTHAQFRHCPYLCRPWVEVEAKFASFLHQVTATSVLVAQRGAKASPDATPRRLSFLHQAPHRGQCVSGPTVDAMRTPLTPSYSLTLKTTTSTSSTRPHHRPLLQVTADGTSPQTARLWSCVPLITPPQAHRRHQAPLQLLLRLPRPSTASPLLPDPRRHGRPSLVPQNGLKTSLWCSLPSPPPPHR